MQSPEKSGRPAAALPRFPRLSASLPGRGCLGLFWGRLRALCPKNFCPPRREAHQPFDPLRVQTASRHDIQRRRVPVLLGRSSVALRVVGGGSRKERQPSYYCYQPVPGGIRYTLPVVVSVYCWRGQQRTLLLSCVVPRQIQLQNSISRRCNRGTPGPGTHRRRQWKGFQVRSQLQPNAVQSL